MKYYAVTDDPRELYHYGVKGMKWGQHIFGDKLKSPGYKRAVSKLKSLAGSRKKEEHKHENAVKKSQDRIALTERLYKMDQDRAIYNAINKEQKRAIKQQRMAAKAYRAEEKREMKYAKNEAKMDKYVQQARQGKLKYGKLSADQIQRVQERLQLEANTRRLGSAEKTWKQQKKEARRKGKLSGIERGTAAAMEEVARAGAQLGIAGLKNRMRLDKAAKIEGKRQAIKDKERNKKSEKDWQREAREELRKEAYKAEIRDLSSYNGRHTSAMNFDNYLAAKRLKAIKDRDEQKRIEDNRRQLQDRVYEKLLLGGKGATSKQVEEAWNNREQIYEKVYGKKPSNTNNSKVSNKTAFAFTVTDHDLFGNETKERRMNGTIVDKLNFIPDTAIKLDKAGKKAYRRYKQKKARKKSSRKYDQVIEID